MGLGNEARLFSTRGVLGTLIGVVVAALGVGVAVGTRNVTGDVVKLTLPGGWIKAPSHQAFEADIAYGGPGDSFLFVWNNPETDVEPGMDPVTLGEL